MISVIIPIYHNEDVLQVSIPYLNAQKLITEIILVFDGYEVPWMWKNIGLPKIKAISNYPDIEWGNARARNIGAINTSNYWLMFLDADHIIVDSITIEDINEFSLLTANKFRREHEGQIQYPSGSVMLHRNLFFKIGGYEEEFCGSYGYEDLQLIDKCIKNGGEPKLHDINLGVLKNAAVKLPRDTTRNKMLYEKYRDAIYS